MNRTLEEILNTPVEFKEGMRVFSLFTFKFGTIYQLGSDADYPIDLLDDNGDEACDCYTIDGKYHVNRTYRSLLTEQEAYELFPSLKPKVYEYQVLSKMHGQITYKISLDFYVSIDDFLEEAREVSSRYFILELYQPSKRERKS